MIASRAGQLVEARHVVENALSAYCAAVDERDSAQLRQLLGDTQVIFRGRKVEDNIGDFYQEAFDAAPKYVGTRHVYTNLSVQADSSVEGQVSYRAAYQRWELTTERVECVAHGHYAGTIRGISAADETTDHQDRAWAWRTHSVTVVSSATPQNG